MRKNVDQGKNSSNGTRCCQGADRVIGRENERTMRSRVAWPIIAAVMALAPYGIGCGSDGTPLAQAGAGANVGTDGATSTTPKAGTGSYAGTQSVQGGTGAGIVTGKGGAPSKTGAGGKSGGAGKTGAKAGAGGKGTAGKTGAAGKASDGTAGSKGLGLIPVDKIDGMDGAKGPYETAPEDLATGPNRASGVFRPAELGKNGEKHPVFVWSCGGGTAPNAYIEHFHHMASYGIVVVADAPPTPATGQAILASMTWIIKENETQGSIFYQKLDTSKIGIGGHSMGSLNTLIAGPDPRVGTTVNVCGGSGTGTTGAADYHSPALYLGEVNEGGTINFTADFDATPSPVVFLIHESTNNNLNDHIMCARDNMAAWIAWLRWQLAGETKWKTNFFLPDGIYCKSPWASCESKNW
jgi:hypothetical protein